MYLQRISVHHRISIENTMGFFEKLKKVPETHASAVFPEPF